MRNCLSCNLRPRNMGGNGKCPKVVVIREGYMRESMYGRDISCPDWKIGDLKKKPVNVNSGSLF